jgi:lambda family phage minor tail protein L
MTIKTEIQKLQPSARLEFFVLDATVCGGGITRFHNYVDNGPLTWQGEVYDPWGMQAEGFNLSADSQARPRVTLANPNGAISALCMAYDDFIGAKLTRKRTMARYLDAVNFPGGNPTADPAQTFPDDVWFVERKLSETRVQVEFELSSAYDLAGRTLPRRQIIANKCLWLTIGGYRGPYCGYIGGPVAEADDTPTGSMLLDKCGGRVSSCKLRFGATSPLPYGGFPAASMAR